MRQLTLGAAAFVTMAIFMWQASAQQDQPMPSVKEVMNKAHGKDNLVRKILLQKATNAEKERLLELYVILGKNKAPHGEPASWQAKTSKLLEAAKAAAKDASKENLTSLRAAVDCKMCHAAHRKE